MILDARTDAIGERLVARVAILGAGAAGLTLAERLSKTLDGVLLVESGGMAIDGQTQALAEGRNVGLPYFDLLSVQLRFYGGSTNHWGGYCRANDPIDFERRPEIGLPGWPLTRAELDPWLDEATDLLGLVRGTDAVKVIKARGLSTDGMIDGQSEALETRVFQLTKKLKMGEVLGPTLKARSGLRQVLNLTAVELVPEAGGRRIGMVRARTLDGKAVEIRADHFVLCCHGFENARLLLESTSLSPEGIGNRSGQVGRNFADHPAVDAGRFYASDRFPELYNIRFGLEQGITANMSLSADAMRRFGTTSYFGRFHPVYRLDETFIAASNLRRDFFKPFDPGMIEDVKALLSDPEGVLNLGKRALGLGRTPLYYKVRHRIDQAPNPASRLVPTGRRNRLGQRVYDLDWQLSARDFETFRVGQEVQVREVSALGLGRFEEEPITPALVKARARGNYHLMGTTRMAARPEDGVVDRDGRVFGVDNLYVAGSSIFPSPGYGGPTMQIIALAKRLGDHLLARVAA
jgi:choline dehydrogenase-like flavoprotein